MRSGAGEAADRDIHDAIENDVGAHWGARLRASVGARAVRRNCVGERGLVALCSKYLFVERTSLKRPATAGLWLGGFDRFCLYRDQLQDRASDDSTARLVPGFSKIINLAQDEAWNTDINTFWLAVELFQFDIN